MKRYQDSDDLYDWKVEYSRLWREMVPRTGRASTTQGELIRILGTVTREAYQNGNSNWSVQHEDQLKFVEQTLTCDNFFDRPECAEIHRRVAEIIEAHNTPDLSGAGSHYYYLTERVVDWCMAHAEPVELVL